MNTGVLEPASAAAEGDSFMALTWEAHSTIDSVMCTKLAANGALITYQFSHDRSIPTMHNHDSQARSQRVQEVCVLAAVDVRAPNVRKLKE